MIAVRWIQECFHFFQLVKHRLGFGNVENKYFHISDCDRHPRETILDGTVYNKFFRKRSAGALCLQ
jgi:hypothetical protein